VAKFDDDTPTTDDNNMDYTMDEEPRDQLGLDEQQDDELM
jgi:hypothetical protein